MSDEAAKVVPNPRPQEEINAEYGQMCAHIGDRIHKQEILTLEIEQIKKRLHALDAESRELAKQKAEIEAHNKKIDEEKAAKKLGAVK